MQKYYFLALLLLVPALMFIGCAASGSSPILGTIGDEPLTLEEFEDSYAKHNGGWEKATASSLEDRERFLDLLVKFKLKVMEARDRGLLADTSIQNELEGYRVSVATSYTLEKELIKPWVEEMYNRLREEIRARHILIRVGEDAAPADTLEAYNKAMKVIGLMTKISFDTLAVTYSEDQSASFNKGDLGFFSMGRMVSEFEDACYSLKVGEYTHEPVRTQYGYHIIQVTAREPNKGAVRVSHILCRFAPSLEDTVAVRDSAWAIYNLVRGGLDFAKAASQYSQDPGSSQNGGEIGYFERGRLQPNIEELFFRTPVDSITEPFQAPYGYHIFKITGTRGIGTFRELENNLRQQYQQMRYQSDYQDYVHELKKRYQLNFDVEVFHWLTMSFDSTMTPARETWHDTLTSATKQRILLSCGDRSYTVQDFVQHVSATAEFNTMLLTPTNVEYMVERMSEAKVLEEHARKVHERHPAFVELMREYQNGILLYRIEQDEIWKKVVVNDSLLSIYHTENKEKYRWPDRVNFAEIYSPTDSIVKVAHDELQAGKDFGEVAEQYTMRQGYKEKKGEWGFQANSLNELSRYAAILTVDSVTSPFEHPSGWSIIKVLAKDSSRVKSFEEAKPELISAFQEYASKIREQEWVSVLRTKFPVVTNKELLSRAFTRKQSAGN
ncbi:MAG: hypothetical protein FJ217_09060 [Ignavibacteria bacterium]|nr:hypothetical protein [Ignavibacteria bacterium]